MASELTEIRIPKNLSNLLIVYIRNLDLTEYHFNRPYLENLRYNEYEMKDYGKGLLKYKNHIFFDINTNVKYLIPIQELTEIEKIALKPFCNCYKHTNIFFKYFSRNITDCVFEGMFRNQKNIDDLISKYKKYYHVK